MKKYIGTYLITYPRGRSNNKSINATMIMAAVTKDAIYPRLFFKSPPTRGIVFTYETNNIDK